MHAEKIKAEAVNLILLIVQNKRGSSGLTFATLTFKDCWPIGLHDLKDIQQMCVWKQSHSQQAASAFNSFVSQSSESVQSLNVITNILSFVTINILFSGEKCNRIMQFRFVVFSLC